MKELNLNIENVTAEGNEIVIRTGTALPLENPNPIDIDGNIDAVSRFIRQRGLEVLMENSIDIRKAVILVDRENLTINLHLDPEDPFAGTITGSLQINPDLKPFCINKDRKFTREELVSLLKLNRIFFADREEHAKMLSSIKNFRANVNKDIQAGSDGRGNNTKVNNQTVDTEVPLDFKLHMPIFKGDSPSTFIVEVGIDVTDGSTRFWLESLELNELLISKRDEVFERELSTFEGFCVIEQ